VREKPVATGAGEESRRKRPVRPPHRGSHGRTPADPAQRAPGKGRLKARLRRARVRAKAEGRAGKHKRQQAARPSWGGARPRRGGDFARPLTPLYAAHAVGASAIATSRTMSSRTYCTPSSKSDRPRHPSFYVPARSPIQLLRRNAYTARPPGALPHRQDPRRRRCRSRRPTHPCRRGDACPR
jgi:hypothetical protein